MIHVESRVTVQEPGKSPTGYLEVSSHQIWNTFVVLDISGATIEEGKLCVHARELEAAIRNATNVAR